MSESNVIGRHLGLFNTLLLYKILVDHFVGLHDVHDFLRMNHCAQPLTGCPLRQHSTVFCGDDDVVDRTQKQRKGHPLRAPKVF